MRLSFDDKESLMESLRFNNPSSDSDPNTHRSMPPQGARRGVKLLEDTVPFQDSVSTRNV